VLETGAVEALQEYAPTFPNALFREEWKPRVLGIVSSASRCDGRSLFKKYQRTSAT